MCGELKTNGVLKNILLDHAHCFNNSHFGSSLHTETNRRLAVSLQSAIGEIMRFFRALCVRIESFTLITAKSFSSNKGDMLKK